MWNRNNPYDYSDPSGYSPVGDAANWMFGDSYRALTSPKASVGERLAAIEDLGLSVIPEGKGGAVASKLLTQLARDGVKSLEKTVSSLSKRIVEHEGKIAEANAAGGESAGRHTSSMEREVAGFKTELDEAQRLLERIRNAGERGASDAKGPGPGGGSGNAN